MNASQAALVDKFASEPLEQSEMWVGDCILIEVQATAPNLHGDPLFSKWGPDGDPIFSEMGTKWGPKN